MNINPIGKNSFNGLLLGIGRSGTPAGEFSFSFTTKIQDEMIADMFCENHLLDKLNNKNTDVVMISSNDNTRRDIFLLNSTDIGDSYIPVDANNIAYKTSISSLCHDDKSILTRIKNFIKKAEKYADKPYSDFDKPKEKFIDTQIGKQLFHIALNDDLEVLAGENVVSSAEEIFPTDRVT